MRAVNYLRKRFETEAKPKQNGSKTETNNNNNVNNNENINENILLEKESKEKIIKSEIFQESIQVNSEAEERKKVAQKKERQEYPDIDTFVSFAREIYQNELKRDFSPFEFAVRSKYESWINAKWKDGQKMD